MGIPQVPYDFVIPTVNPFLLRFSGCSACLWFTLLFFFYPGFIFMIRLSQKGWNNVMIYTVLILVALFIGLPEYLKQGRNEPQPQLISINQTLLALHFPKHQIERAGPGWRSQPAVLSEEQLTTLLQLWQQSSLPEKSPLDPINPVLISEVTIWLTGKPAQQQWQLYQAGDYQWLKALDTELWYRLPAGQADLLFPSVLR